MNIVEQADTFALAAHAAVGQVRKYTSEPYTVHTREVAHLVASVTGDRYMIAAALLHDVVEDTKVTIELIEATFGEEVAELVGWLTDVSKPEDGNRTVRKALDREHMAKAPPAAKTIKLADFISNTKSIVAHDPGFAHIYLKEKALCLPFLAEGDTRLFDEATRLLNLGKDALGL